jgi:hypothetical protein
MRIFKLFKRNKTSKIYLVMSLDYTEGSFSNVVAAFKSDKEAIEYSRSYGKKTGVITYICIVNLQ